MKYLLAALILLAAAPIAMAQQQSPTITQLLAQGFAVVGTNVHPPQIMVFLRKDNILIFCEAGGYPIVTQRCSRIE